VARTHSIAIYHIMAAFMSFFQSNVRNYFSGAINKITSFDWSSLLMYEEPIAGFSITSDAIMYASLVRDPKTGGIYWTTFATEPLREGVLEEGRIADEKMFHEALVSLRKKIGDESSSVILSLPSEIFFTLVLRFPNALDEGQVREMLDLNMTYLLPLSTGEVYVDAEKTGDRLSEEQRVLVASGMKKEIDPYLASLQRAGFFVIAVEPFFFSLKRILPVSGKTLLVLDHAGKRINMAVFEAGVPRFTRSVRLPLSSSVSSSSGLKETHAALLKEVQAVVHFYASDPNSEKPIEQIVVLDHVIGTESFLTELSRRFSVSASLLRPDEALAEGLSLQFSSEERRKLEGKKASLAACGAARRGFLSRAEDDLISLMPVGTEEAYDKRRAISFAHFIRNLTYGLSLFFLLILGSVYVLLSFMSTSLSSNSTQGELSQNVIALQEEASALNDKTHAMIEIHDNLPHWSLFFDTFDRLLVPGVEARNVLVAAPSDPIAVTLHATTVTALLEYKKNLEDSGIFEEIKIPFSVLAQQEDITFDFSLKLRDPSFVYVK